MSNYSELLKDPRWQRLRLRVFERDDWRCLQCHDHETTLNVHHTFYEHGRMPWEYHIDSLLTLCEPCHARAPLGQGGSLLRYIDGFRTAAEEVAWRAAVEQWRAAAKAMDEDAVKQAMEALRAARTLTLVRVRARPEDA